MAELSELFYDFSTAEGIANARFFIGTQLQAEGETCKVGSHAGSTNAPIFTTRLSFTISSDLNPPANGFSHFSFKIANAHWVPTNGGNSLVKSGNTYTHNGNDVNKLFRFAITPADETDEDFVSYANVNAVDDPTIGDGYVSCVTNETGSAYGSHSDGGYYMLTGEVDKILEPGKSYYLWFFPCYNFYNNYRCWAFSNASSYFYKPKVTLAFSGEAAPPVPEIVSTILWAFDGTKWVQGIQRVFDGTKWL
jgi:hypothetical protein